MMARDASSQSLDDASFAITSGSESQPGTDHQGRSDLHNRTITPQSIRSTRSRSGRRNPKPSAMEVSAGPLRTPEERREMR